MITKSNVIERFLEDLNNKISPEDESAYGTVEKLRQFAIREGYLQEEKQDTKS